MKTSRCVTTVNLFIAFMLAASLLTSITTLCSPSVALAANAGEDGYVSELLEDTPSWDEGVITNMDGYSGGGNTTSLMTSISNLLRNVASIALGIGITAVVARFVGRAIIELLEVPTPAIPTFFRVAGEESKDPGVPFGGFGGRRGGGIPGGGPGGGGGGGGPSRSWVLPMAKSCIFYVGITISVWGIINIIALIIAFVSASFGY